MENNEIKESASDILLKTTEILSKPSSYETVYKIPLHSLPMPDYEILREIVNTLRQILFPGYFGASNINSGNIGFYTGVNVDKVHKLLCEQILRGMCFDCNQQSITNCKACEENVVLISAKFISLLPKIRETLSTDVKAMYDGDPAAKSLGEII